MQPHATHAHPDAQARRQMLADFARQCEARQSAAWTSEERASDQSGPTSQRNADKSPQ